MKKAYSIFLGCILFVGIGQGLFTYGEVYDRGNTAFIETELNQQNDVLEGISEEQQNTQICIDETRMSTRSLSGSESCIAYCSSHGPGRENGGKNLLSVGCRNYMGGNYENYGTVDIPF